MDKNVFWGRTALFVTTIIWGTSFIILKNTLDDIGVLWILAMRFCISAALLLAIAGKRIKKTDRASVKGSVYIGLCLAAAYIVQTYGLKYTTPGKNAFLTSTYCVIVPFLAWLYFKRRPHVHNILAALLCIAGVNLVALNSGFGNINIGDILTVMSGFFYAMQIILMEKYVKDCDTVIVSAIEFSTGAIICLLCALIFESAPTAISSESVFSVLYLALMCTAVCFFLQAWGMKYTPSSQAAMILTLESVFGAIFSVLLYGEKLSLKLICGFGLIFIAVVLSEYGGKMIRAIKKM